jgi:hypothetical protein
MRPLPIRPVPAGTTPTALRGKSALRATLAAAVATAIGFAPAIVFASPAAAAPGQYTIANASVTEAGDLVFQVRRPGGVAPEQEVTFKTVAGSAKPGVDFTADTGTLTFPANVGSNEQVLQVTIETDDDDLDEADESLLLQVVDETNATITTARGTILDDDATPSYSLSTSDAPDESDDEVITATLTAESGRDIEIPVSTVEGTAKAGQDFTALPAGSKITIPAGESEGTINVSILDDELDEDTAQLFQVVGSATGARNVTGTDSATVTINDNDSEPELAVLGATSVEGGTLSFPVTLSAASEQVVTVAYETGDGDTTVVEDYTAASGTLTFAPGETSKTVTVVTKINADLDDEAVETLTLTLSDPVNATLEVGAEDAEGSILGEGSLPTVSLAPAPATVSEPTGDTPSVTQTFTATLSAASPNATSFTYSVGSAGNGVGFATPGADFTATSSPVVVTFAPNQTVKTFTVPVLGDTTHEADETFNLLLASPVGIGPGADLGTNVVTIADNDDVPVFTVAASKSMPEGDGPSNATFAITLSNASDEAVDFVVETTDGTAKEAVAAVGSNDYDVPGLIVTIPAGSTTGTITIPVIGDEIFEADEELTFTVDTAGAEDDATGPAVERTLTLTNDDLAPKLTVTSQSGIEGSDVAVIGVVTGMAQADTDLDLEFDGGAWDGTDPAEASDFTDPGTKTVTIAAGTDPGTIMLLQQVSLKNDTIDEPFETIVVSGTPDVVGAGVVVSGAIGITDDVNDLPPSISIDDETIDEFQASVDVDVDLDFPAGTTATEQVITVQYATQNGAAFAGSDYTAKSGTVTFNPGQTNRKINVPILNDEMDEVQGEDFFVNLSSPAPTGVSLADTKGEVLIYDNDATVKPSIVATPSPRVGVGAVTVSGTVRPDSTVKLLTAPVSGGALTVVAYAQANAAGNYMFTRYLPTGTRVATWANELQSDVVTVRIGQSPALQASSPRKGAATLKVTGNPKAAGLPVKLFRWNAGSKTWSTVATGTTNDAGVYTRTLTGLKSGSRIMYRAYIGGDADQGLLAGYSVNKTVGIR